LHLDNRRRDTFNFAAASSAARVETEEIDTSQAERTNGKMSTRWMPRRLKPKKDAETGETFRGSCIQAKNPENPNGATLPE
jgi:hypothetical protein